jgi:hypothetical protein
MTAPLVVMYRGGITIQHATHENVEVLAYQIAPYFNRTYKHYCSHQHAPSSGLNGNRKKSTSFDEILIVIVLTFQSALQFYMIKAHTVFILFIRCFKFIMKSVPDGAKHFSMMSWT